MTNPFLTLLKEKMDNQMDPDSLGIRRICFYREKKLLEVTLQAPSVLSCGEYEHIIDIIREKTGTDAVLYIEADDTALSSVEMQKYLTRMYDADPETQILSSSIMQYDSARRTLSFQYSEKEEKSSAD